MSERRQRLWTVAIALGIALVVVLGTRTARITDRWYADHSHYRAQVDAFLSGRLAVATVPEGLRHDLAWTDSGVQQVWGLGVPAWQTPFELIGRVVGLSPFPDRVALLAFLALVFYALLRAWRPRGDDGETRWSHAGVVLIAGLLPAFVTLLRGRLGVYEEAAAYAYGTAILLACGTVALHRTPTRRGFWLLVFAAGLTGFVRPTVWFYGFATLVVASGIWLAHAGTWRRALPAIALAGGLFVIGGGALYATNAMRFGAGGEFGHRLNLELGIPGNITATRFSYPFEHVGLVDAATELIGATFDRPEHRSRGGRGFYQRDLFAGQSSVVRWREFYFTAYTWMYVPLLVAALIIGAIAWLRRRVAPDLATSRQRVLAVWAVLGVAPIAAFYLHSPSISSRYLLDFAPAVAVLVLVVWRRVIGAVSPRRSRLAFLVLLALWGASIIRARRHRPRVGSEPVARATAARATYPRSRPITYARTLPTAYDLADPLIAEHLELPTYDRCYASTGDELDCALPAVPGDRHIRGERLDFLDEAAEHPWRFTVRELPAPALEDPWCTADDPDATIAEPSLAPGTCGFGDALLSHPAAIQTAVWYAPPPLYLNGDGWNLATGEVEPALSFFVEDPAFLELEVASTVGDPADWIAVVRVAIGLLHLEPRAITSTPRGVRMRFVPPAGKTMPTGLEVVFIALGDDARLDQPSSGYALHRIAWR